MTPDYQRKKSTRGFTIALVLSFVAHLSLLWFFFFGSNKASKPKPPEKVITTVLVRQGNKERPKHLLPRLPSAPPPANVPEEKVVKPQIAPAPVEEKKVPLAPEKAVKKDAPKQKEEKPNAKKEALERLQRLSRMQKALERFSQEDDDEGEPDGDNNGQVSSQAQAILGNRYMTQVKAKVMPNFTMPNVISEQVCAALAPAMVVIRVAADGSIISKNLEKSSGNSHFDTALIQAINRTGKLPPPPDAIASRIRDDGIELYAPCKTAL